MTRLSKLFRIILWSVLTWFILALLWAFLPFPSSEHDSDNGSDYPTAVLRAGRTLTRVYSGREFPVGLNTRSAFALSYTFNPEAVTLSISGLNEPLPIINPLKSLGTTLNSTEEITATARIGDPDGANLPSFAHADAILLFWTLHRETISLPLTVYRSTDLSLGTSTLSLHITPQTQTQDQIKPHHSNPNELLTIHFLTTNASSLSFTTPAKPHSTSPSVTYPVRVAIILILAPPAVFLGLAYNVLSLFVNYFFSIVFYGFCAFGIWKCFAGKLRERLEGWRGSEGLGIETLDGVRLKGRLERLYDRFRGKERRGLASDEVDRQREGKGGGVV